MRDESLGREIKSIKMKLKPKWCKGKKSGECSLRRERERSGGKCVRVRRFVKTKLQNKNLTSQARQIKPRMRKFFG